MCSSTAVNFSYCIIFLRSAFWFVMLSALIMLRFLVALAFLIINIMINNASDPELLGFVNGFAMTVSTIGRFVYLLENLSFILPIKNLKTFFEFRNLDKNFKVVPMNANQNNK